VDSLFDLRIHVVRIVYRSAYMVIYAYWALFRPNCSSVQIIVRDADEILLVRHSYMHRDTWGFPGGRIKNGETAEASAKRELFEELGLQSSLELLGTCTLFHDYHYDTVHVFLASGCG
jgi:8-oxo-dGTP diphosphatase